MLIDGSVGRADLSKLEVVCPAEQDSVQAFHDRPLVQQSVPRLCQFADLAAYAHYACLARARANIGSSRTPAVVASDAIPEELNRLLRHSQAAGLLRVDR